MGCMSSSNKPVNPNMVDDSHFDQGIPLGEELVYRPVVQQSAEGSRDQPLAFKLWRATLRAPNSAPWSGLETDKEKPSEMIFLMKRLLKSKVREHPFSTAILESLWMERLMGVLAHKEQMKARRRRPSHSGGHPEFVGSAFLHPVVCAYQTPREWVLISPQPGSATLRHLLKYSRIKAPRGTLPISEEVVRFFIVELLLALTQYHGGGKTTGSWNAHCNICLDSGYLRRDGHVQLGACQFMRNILPRNWDRDDTDTHKAQDEVLQASEGIDRARALGHGCFLAPELLATKLGSRVACGREVDWYALGQLAAVLLDSREAAHHSASGVDNNIEDDGLPRDELVHARCEGSSRGDSNKWIFHRDVSNDAIQFVRELSAPLLQQRPNTLEAIQALPWFVGIDWNLAAQRQLQPPYVKPEFDDLWDPDKSITMMYCMGGSTGNDEEAGEPNSPVITDLRAHTAQINLEGTWNYRQSIPTSTSKLGNGRGAAAASESMPIVTAVDV